MSAENKGEHDLVGGGYLSGSKEHLWHSTLGHLATGNLREPSHKVKVSNFDFDHKKLL